jgi:flagellar protein FlbD
MGFSEGEPVIEVTRLDGSRLIINSEHIRSVEANPDTVICFVDGKRLVVLEQPQELVGKVIEFRARILRAASCCS